MIQHAWHFGYAVVSVLKCNAAAWSLRASHLNWALCARKIKSSLERNCFDFVNRLFRVCALLTLDVFSSFPR